MDNDHWLILDFCEWYKCLRFYPESTNFITSGDLRFLWYIIKKSPPTPVEYLTFTSTTILYECPKAWWSDENFCTCGVKSGNKGKNIFVECWSNAENPPAKWTILFEQKIYEGEFKYHNGLSL